MARNFALILLCERILFPGGPSVACRRDLLADIRYPWRGDQNYAELNSQVQPAHIFRVRRWFVGEKFV